MVEKVRIFLWRVLGFSYKRIYRGLDYVFLKDDCHTVIGNGSYDNGAKVYRWSSGKIEIGKYCCIARDVDFIVDGGGHTYSKITSYPFWGNVEENSKSGIVIGNDVWIGLGAKILPGVKIGNGVTIAAGSVVTIDIPDYCLAGGVPAKVIKYKHSQKNIDELNKIEWWNWADSEMDANKDDLRLGVEDFVLKYKNSK